MSARGNTPTLALSARALLVVARQAGEGAQRVLDALSRLRGSAASSCYPLPLAGEGGARVSARRVGGSRQKFRYRMDPLCGLSGNDNKIKEDTL